MKNVIVFAATAFVAAAFAAATPARAQEVTSFNLAGSGQVLVTTMPVETKVLRGAPYSAEVVIDSTQTLADGNRIVQHSTGRVYRDGQGRVRREEDRAAGNPAISIIDPVAGVSYSLDPERHIAWKTPTPAGEEIMKKLKAKMEVEAKLREGQEATAQTASGAEELQRRREEENRKLERKLEDEAKQMKVAGGQVFLERSGSGGEQHSEEPLAARLVEGVRAEGHRRTTTISAGAIGNELPITIVSEEWVSPELQVLLMTQRKDPRNGDSSYRLVNVVRGEPDGSLFQVPSDYVVRETGIRRLEPAQRER